MCSVKKVMDWKVPKCSHGYKEVSLAMLLCVIEMDHAEPVGVESMFTQGSGSRLCNTLRSEWVSVGSADVDFTGWCTVGLGRVLSSGR